MSGGLSMRGNLMFAGWDDDAWRLEMAELLESCGRTWGASVLRSQLPTYRDLIEARDEQIAELEGEISELEDVMAGHEAKTSEAEGDRDKALADVKRLRAELANCGVAVV